MPFLNSITKMRKLNLMKKILITDTLKVLYLIIR